ncbi:MAG: hypothetical protein H6870_13415 [Methylobacteriaceae bacterium]|nr:hypothetical protein [Methylobacteriaceae bacterium]
MQAASSLVRCFSAAVVCANMASKFAAASKRDARAHVPAGHGVGLRCKWPAGQILSASLEENRLVMSSAAPPLITIRIATDIDELRRFARERNARLVMTHKDVGALCCLAGEHAARQSFPKVAGVRNESSRRAIG